MRTLNHPRELAQSVPPVVLAIGSFDGVHRGHQALIARARAEAGRLNGQTWVLTFDPHPLKILRPQEAPDLLTSTAHKLRLLSEQNVEGCICLPFTRELSLLSAEDFIRSLRNDIPALRVVVVGTNWRFGHRAQGNAGLLKKLAPAFGFQAVVLEPVSDASGPISSSRIRDQVAAGNLDQAAALLGRPFSILGTVKHGRRIGRKLGYPTANLDPHNEVEPPPGIYAVYAMVDGVRHNGAAYLAEPPPGAAAPAETIVEVYLLDADMVLYGRDLEVFFVARLRGDRRFPSEPELKQQIARDIEQARAVLTRLD